MSSPSFINVPERLRVTSEQWRMFAWQLLCDLRVATPGIVKSFDSQKQTVEVQPAIRENVNQNLVSTPVDLPLLVNVPVLFPRAGGFSLTFPINAGDECLVVFADMCFDAWWQSGGTQNQIDRRRHDLADGIAIFGIWSQPRVLQNYSTSSVQLRSDSGDKFIEIDGSRIHVKADTIAIEGGNVTIDGDSVKIKGKEFLTHKHTSVQTGSSNSGGVF